MRRKKSRRERGEEKMGRGMEKSGGKRRRDEEMVLKRGYRERERERERDPFLSFSVFVCLFAFLRAVCRVESAGWNEAFFSLRFVGV
jgi:hypothetical protein